MTDDKRNLTQQELVMAIRCCTSDNACFDCPLCNADVDDCNDKQRQAADLIETLMAELEQVKRERESPKPLTLEELREMDGEPVWIRGLLGLYSSFNGYYVFAYHTERDFFLRSRYPFPMDVYRKTWLAYRRKPEEAHADG